LADTSPYIFLSVLHPIPISSSPYLFFTLSLFFYLPISSSPYLFTLSLLHSSTYRSYIFVIITRKHDNDRILQAICWDTCYLVGLLVIRPA